MCTAVPMVGFGVVIGVVLGGYEPPVVLRRSLFLEMVVSSPTWAGELGEGKGHRRIHPRRGRKKNPPRGEDPKTGVTPHSRKRSDCC